ncbi:cysteine synthase B [Salmonella enterica subsp. enterica]|uniref:Cysteine synthase B n=1 Tax=Salmonella enterica I TaxID=59201 RepID=A0A447TYK2_SALET|nr:cysteine synthase B [Salmonella enterica subsp. enterica]
MNTLEQTIGNTPLVKLQRLGPDNGSEIWVKLEGNNPAGSVKDRAALSMIVEAEKRGEIKPGDVLIEATSGNTGIALAMIAALKGYRMKLLMPDNMSQERRAAMRAYGAELILVTKEQGMEGARDLALAMSERGEGKLLDQFNNPDNPYAHYTTTGPEIWRQTSGRITPFCLQHGHDRHHYRRVAFSARAGKTGHHRWPTAGRGQQYSGHSTLACGIYAGHF